MKPKDTEKIPIPDVEEFFKELETWVTPHSTSTNQHTIRDVESGNTLLDQVLDQVGENLKLCFNKRKTVFSIEVNYRNFLTFNTLLIYNKIVDKKICF